jgi:hypothetical protein
MTETKTARKGYLKELTARFEDGAEQFMKTWRAEARRPGPRGEMSYRSLELVHGGFEVTARSLARIEKATQPPARTARHPVPHPAARHGAPKEPTAEGPAA